VTEIPYDRLGIPEQHIKAIEPTAPLQMRIIAAKGMLPLPPEAMVAVCFVLQGDDSQQVRSHASSTVKSMPIDKLVANISSQSHPKLLEFIVEARLDEMSLHERVLGVRVANDRTVRLIASNGNTQVLELLVRNQERLLVDPDLYLVMRDNVNFTENQSARVESFLRLHRCLPDLPEEDAPAQLALDDAARLEAEVEAALLGMPSPTTFESSKGASLEMFNLDDDIEEDDGLGVFEFSFAEDEMDFGWSLMGSETETAEEKAEEGYISVEKQVAALTVGQKIKLAYGGNAQVRKVLLRDSNKLVAGAVIKSGRMNDAEILSAAGNRNLPAELVAEIARNKEAVRRYPVKVALVNNSKTPVPVALGFIKDLQKGDLKMLTTNRNVPAVVSTAATRLFKKKFSN